MSDPLQPLLFELLDEAQDRAPHPSLLYHYTGQGGLIGVVTDRHIHASEVRHLNDQREYLHALQLVTPLVEDRATAGSLDATAGPFWDAIRLGLSVVPTMHVFVSSFSEKGDQLSQWRAYCTEGGYAIAFKPDVLRSCALHMTDFCLLLKCVYDVNDQKAIVEDILDRLRDHYLQHHSSWPSGDADTAYGSAFATVLGILAACFKDPGFAEEEEWRLVIRQWAIDAKATPPTFRTGRRNIVPFLRIPLASKGRSAVAGIKVGPTPHMSEALKAAEWLLRANGLSAASVDRTTIPFRDW